jgi:hypothetical protein
MIFRILAGAAMAALGYYVGREVGRTETIREELERARARQGRVIDQEAEPAPEQDVPGPAGKS